MRYLSLLLCAVLSVALAQDRTEVLQDGAFNFPFVVDEDIRQQSGVSTMYLTTSHRCVYSFIITTELEQSSVLTIERVSGVDKDGEYTFGKVGEGEATAGVSEITVNLAAAPSCGSTWRLVVQSANTAPWKAVAIVAKPVEETVIRKRAEIACDMPETYPAECSAASEGALCLSTNLCGCKLDKDCFGNTDYPYCTPAGECERCTEKEPTGAGVADHLFCRNRYPGFATQPTTGDTLGSERVAPLSYYREVCIRNPPTASGSCQRCNQAPIQPYNLGSTAINQGASGTFHCANVGLDKPICMDQAYMTFVGGTYDLNRRGACGPCLINKECSAAFPTKPVCVVATGACGPCATNADCATANGTNCQKDGSCRKCTSNTDCGALDGGEAPNQPNCNVATGLCEALFQCTDNASCNGRTGNNCQLDKSCVTCTSNALCGGLDGGETPGQQVCNIATGICGTCSKNSDCVGTGGANCQQNGVCKTCVTNTDCGTSDGGETSGQAVCNTQTGICEDACTTNTFCQTKPGKNCQVDGTCLSCTSDATCGASDGGEVVGQTKCNTALGLCTTPFQCTDNASCEAQGQGKNCQKDSSCISCTANTCGTLDGGETANQPNCDSVTRLCVAACAKNSDCQNTQGANCNKDGRCVTCTVNTDCGSTDGGETPDQSVCNTATGICEAPCTSNADCAGRAGKNCYKDGTCRSCTANSECGSTDGGEVTDQPACDTDTGICTPCGSNDDCPNDTPNCGADGGCYHCNSPGNTCGAMDGPPGGPGDNQPNCDTITGKCVAFCTADDQCTDDCSPYCHLNRGCCVQCLENDHCPGENWRDDQEEYDVCSSNSYTCVKGCSIDDDCEEDDKPACSPTTGECVECLFDSHCDDFTPVCASSQTCTECVYDGHCQEGQKCVELQCTANEEGSAASLASLSLSVLSLLFVTFF